MNRKDAAKFAREKLDEYGLNEWGIRINPKMDGPLGICLYKDQVIIINGLHVDTHPEPEVKDTILHEIAHALVGSAAAHGPTWTTKAMEIGVNNLSPCSTLSLSPQIIDAIRSGATVEVEFEERTIHRNVTVEEKVYEPKYKVTRLQDRCPECGKVAKEKFSITTTDKDGNEMKLITLECFHIIKKIIPAATPFDKMMSNDWKPEVKNCKHIFPTRDEIKDARAKGLVLVPNQCKKCQEFKLYPFQVLGARAAEIGLTTQKGFGVFDDMGLGKTVQGLAIPKYHKEYCPFMVVTKSAITFQWFKQVIRWLGPDYLPQIIRTSRDYIMPGLKCYIIPYDLLRRFPMEKLQKIGLKLVILDECQQIKNPDSARTKEVRRLVGDLTVKVLPLSGTPWKNRGDEFFPVLNMIDPVKFYSHQHFLDTWVQYYYHGNKKKMGGIRNIERFKAHTAGLLIRREYDEVMEDFPDVNRMKLNVQLDEFHQGEYSDAESEFVEWYNQYIIGGTEDSINGIELLAKMTRMRHVTGLAKIPATLEFVDTFVEETDRKLVIFVHHKDVGRLLHSALTNTDKDSNPEWFGLAETIKDEDIKVFQYTSQHTGKPEGFQIQEDFNASKRCIMVASTLACGEGLDLQTCCDTLMHERQWNPQNEDQAAPGRFKRIGQLSGVINVTVPEAEGTIDEHLDGLVSGKRERYHVVMNKGELPKWNQDAFARDLAQMIVAKHKERTKGKEIKRVVTPSMASI